MKEKQKEILEKEEEKVETTSNIHNVIKGDTIYRIAKQYNLTWRELYILNKKIIGTNPRNVKPGMKLKIK